MLNIPTAHFILSFVITLILIEHGTTVDVISDDLTIEMPDDSSRIQMPMQSLNNPVVASIHSPSGDIIDCFPIDKQPAFDHPLLKNHKIQTTASSKPQFKEEKILQNSTSTTGRAPRVWQEWQNVGSCPNGTVPIYRAPANATLHDGKKTVNIFDRRNNVVTQSNAQPIKHEYATAEMYTNVYGTTARLNIWEPHVEPEVNEFSLAQIWITAGDDEDVNTIEVGWQAYPYLYQDNHPRVFVYWTSDGYKKTGCYNAYCPGFVQVGKQFAPGARLQPSSFYGQQIEIKLLVWKSKNTGNWWLSIDQEGFDVGYWPAELFTHLQDHGTRAAWGGEVINREKGGRHTSTAMGSGYFSREGYEKASYMRELRVMGSVGGTPFAALDLQTVVTNSKCYDIQVESSSEEHWGTFFYYGGPGKNPKCP